MTVQPTARSRRRRIMVCPSGELVFTEKWKGPSTSMASLRPGGGGARAQLRSRRQPCPAHHHPLPSPGTRTASESGPAARRLTPADDGDVHGQQVDGGEVLQLVLDAQRAQRGAHLQLEGRQLGGLPGGAQRRIRSSTVQLGTLPGG